VHDLSRCGYTDDGHAPSSQGAPGRLPGRPAACRSRPHIYSFLLVRVPRPGAEGLLAFGIGSEAGPTRASGPTRCRCRVLAVRGVDSLDGPLPGLPAGISAWSGNGMTGNGGPCVDTRGRVRACLLRRRVPNESSTADGRDGQAWVAFEYEGRSLEPEHGGPARLPVPHPYFWRMPSGVRGLRLLNEDEPGCREDGGYDN
jgi:hypothetical protein